MFDHTIINGGDNTYKGKPLFRGAIMNSGSIIPSATVTGTKANTVYNTVVAAAGCDSAVDKLACLRGLPYEDYLNAVNALPGLFSYFSINIAYLPRSDPADNFFPISPDIAAKANRVARVPVIIGDQEDEGTLFCLALANITTNDQVVTYTADVILPNNPNAVRDVRELLSTGSYPNQPLIGQPAGSPYRTGPLNSISPQFKRLAAVLGDVVFTLSRRVYLSVIQPQGVKTWTYLASYLYGLPVLGTFHASDTLFAFGMLGDADVNPVTNTIQTYYLSFVNHLDPNVKKEGLIEWPQWTDGTRSMLNMQALRNVVFRDDFREAAYRDLRASQGQFVI